MHIIYKKSLYTGVPEACNISIRTILRKQWFHCHFSTNIAKKWTWVTRLIFKTFPRSHFRILVWFESSGNFRIDSLSNSRLLFRNSLAITDYWFYVKSPYNNSEKLSNRKSGIKLWYMVPCPSSSVLFFLKRASIIPMMAYVKSFFDLLLIRYSTMDCKVTFCSKMRLLTSLLSK